MKKISLILIGLFLIPTLFLTSCDKGDDTLVVSTPAQTLMVDYMLANNLDLDKVLTSPDGISFVQPPPADDLALPAFLAKYYIIDIRSAADYNTSRISGAKNVLFANILAEGPLAGTKPILVVCYTGQTACYATALLRMYGYKNTQALKWGMSGWNTATAGPWNSKTASPANGHANWTYNAAPTNLVFSKPSFTSLSTTGEAILKKRVEEVVAVGFKTETIANVLGTPSNYFINNYFSAASNDYLDFGHINGAYRIHPLLISDNSILGINPSPTAKVVTYCYTGQTSAMATAWLRVLGYDAYSLTFGMNGLYSNHPTAWTSNQWGVDSNPKNLTLTTN